MGLIGSGRAGGAGDSADPVVVAVDGGGTKTDVVAVDLDGRVRGRAHGIGSSPQIIGTAASVRRVDELIRQALAQAGAPLRRAHLYLSGLDLPEEIDAYREASASFGWARGCEGEQAVLENDLFALLRAGTDSPDAVAVICGTGSNAVGRRRDGRTSRFLALGRISGDWGGGWDLGLSALWLAARAVDGRGEPTALSSLIPARFGKESVLDLTLALHRGELASEELSRLGPDVLAASDAGDPGARSLVDRQAREVALLAVTSLRRLDLLDRPVPVVLGGGILAAGNRRLLDGIRDELTRSAPRATIQIVRDPPVVGAVLLALEDAGATPDRAAVAAGIG